MAYRVYTNSKSVDELDDNLPLFKEKYRIKIDKTLSKKGDAAESQTTGIAIKEAAAVVADNASLDKNENDRFQIVGFQDAAEGTIPIKRVNPNPDYKHPENYIIKWDDKVSHIDYDVETNTTLVSSNFDVTTEDEKANLNLTDDQFVLTDKNFTLTSSDKNIINGNIELNGPTVTIRNSADNPTSKIYLDKDKVDINTPQENITSTDINIESKDVNVKIEDGEKASIVSIDTDRIAITSDYIYEDGNTIITGSDILLRDAATPTRRVELHDDTIDINANTINISDTISNNDASSVNIKSTNVNIDGKTNITGKLSVSDDTTLDNDLIANGPTITLRNKSENPTSKLYIDSEKITIDTPKLNITGNTNITGNETISGTEEVTGATTLNDTLSVAKKTTLSDELEVAKKATFKDNVQINENDSKTNKLISNVPTELNKTLVVGGNATFNKAVTIGTRSDTIGENSLTVGNNCKATWEYSTAFGDRCEATGHYSHAEGIQAKATQNSAHAEGQETKASGFSAHAEGRNTTAAGYYSHAEGYNNETLEGATSAHVEGTGNIAFTPYAHIQGKNSVKDSAKKFADIVGNGLTENNRSNASALDWDGNLYLKGNVFVECTNESKYRDKDHPNDSRLATELIVDQKINDSAAYYLTKDAQGHAFETRAEFDGATKFYSGGAERIPTRNDYLVVLSDESYPIYTAEYEAIYTTFTTTDDYIDYYVDYNNVKTLVTEANKNNLGITPGTTKPYTKELPTTRYICTASGTTENPRGVWAFQYVVNNTPLSQAQIEAINSGITWEKRVGYDNEPNLRQAADAQLQENIDKKIDLPENPVAGDGLVYDGTKWAKQDGYGYIIKGNGQDITWNGDITGKDTTTSVTNAGYILTKVSSTVIPVEELASWEFQTNEGEEPTTGTVEDLLITDDIITTKDNTMVFIAKHDNIDVSLSMEGENFRLVMPEAGVYFIKVSFDDAVVFIARFTYNSGSSEITWDGSTEGKTSGTATLEDYTSNQLLYKVSNNPIVDSSAITSVILGTNGQDAEISDETAQRMVFYSNQNTIVMCQLGSYTPVIISSKIDNNTFVFDKYGCIYNIELPKAGIYLWKDNSNYVSRFKYGTSDQLHKFDTKYIKDDIVENAKSTGGIGWTDTYEEQSIKWNGNITGKSEINLDNTPLYFQNDIILETPQWYIGKTLKYNNPATHQETSMTVSASDVVALSEDLTKISNKVYIATKDTTYNNVAVAKGVWFAKTSGTILFDWYTSYLAYQKPNVVHQLSSAYIPHDSTKADVATTYTKTEVDNLVNAKSTVSVSSTGTATDEVQYITIDGTEKKLAGGGSSTDTKNTAGIQKNTSDIYLVGSAIKPTSTTDYAVTTASDVVKIDSTGKLLANNIEAIHISGDGGADGLMLDNQQDSYIQITVDNNINIHSNDDCTRFVGGEGIDLDGGPIFNVAAPMNDSDAATKAYVDTEVAKKTKVVGSTSAVSGASTLKSIKIDNTNYNIPDGGDVSSKMDKANPTGTGSFSLNRKASTTVGDYSVALGLNTEATGKESFAQGLSFTSKVDYAITAETDQIYISDNYDLISTGMLFILNNVQYRVLSTSNPAEFIRVSPNISSAAQGDVLYFNNISSGVASFTEGVGTKASGKGSHAEGVTSIASGNSSHAEGIGTIASAGGSHAEGHSTSSSGTSAHAEGRLTEASGYYSHAEGYNTITKNQSQHVSGEYNVIDTSGSAYSRGTYACIVGNGTSSTRSNAAALTWDGTLRLDGDVYTNCAANSTGGNKLSSVSVSTTGSSTTEAKYITVDSTEYKLASGATYTAGTGITIDENNIISNDISPLVPSQATTDNQLADKAFVNSSVQTAAANFRGNWSTWSSVPTDSSQYPADYKGSKIPTVNDYLVVQDASECINASSDIDLNKKYNITKNASAYVFTLTYPNGDTSSVEHVNDGVTVKYLGKNNEFIITSIGNSQHTIKCNYKVSYNSIIYNAGSIIATSMYYNAFSADLYLPSACEGTWRFKYSGEWSTLGKNGWLPEYQVKEVPLTAAQLAALNSGITATKVSAYDAYATTKQDKLTAGTGIKIVDGVISLDLENASGKSF